MLNHRLIAVSLAALCAAMGLSQTDTNARALRDFAQKSKIRSESKKQEAWFKASLKGLETKKILPNGRVVELMEFRGNRPIYAATDNANAAISTRANRVFPGGVAGLSLTGSGVLIGHWDGGTVRTTHQELAGRVILGDAEARSGDHATHVSGTLIASGVNAAAKGMSYQGMDKSFGWTSDTAEMAASAANDGIRLSNHSYGFITGWYNNGIQWYWYGDTAVSQTEDPGFGMYESTSQDWDNVAYNAPFYLICKSAGNDRGEGPAVQPTSHLVFDNATQTWVTSTTVRDRDGGSSGYDTVSYHGVAKNILTVGAVNDVLNYTGPGSVTMTSFSGWGPTDDGRIKPDLVGNGAGLTSSGGSSDTAYVSFSGTSMSTPNVAGSLGLLVQHYRNLNAGSDMRSATLKALAIHTADECGGANGPDYAYGWGLMNTERAAQVISQDSTNGNTITENVLNAGGSSTLSILSDGTQPIRVTICWTDPAANPAPWALDPSTPLLVNDLDVRVSNGATTFTPWILNPASPAAAATTGDNFRDNVEQIYIPAPTAGTYTITVGHKGATLQPAGQQAFSMIVTGAASAPAAAELSNMTLSASTVGGGNSVTGTVTMTNTSGGTVNLSSNNVAATVPATVTVPSGSSSANFTVSTSAVASATTATITASKGSVTVNRNLTVQAAALVSVSVNPTSVVGGNGSTGTVTVSGNIPAGGIVIALSDNSPNVSTPASVTVNQGQTTATFAVSTLSVSASETATITATFESVSKTASLTVNPAVTSNPNVSTLTLSPSTVKGGSPSTGTVTLTAAAGTGGAVVTLTSSNTATATVPASVTVPAGATSATFTVTTNAVKKRTSVSINASRNSVTKSATLVVTK